MSLPCRLVFACLLTRTFVRTEDYETGDDVQKAIQEEVKSLSEDQRSAVPWSSLCPPPAHLTQAACGARPCMSNSDCASRHNHTYLCCHNGCVDTCLRALEPPPDLDWVDEPPDIKKSAVTGQVVAHASYPESVALPGGCIITPAQFLSLQGFKDNKHVEDCFCDNGGVFCKIVE